MKNLFYIILLSVFVFLTGCENVSVVNPDLNYKEYVVVRAELIAGEDFTGVKFTRTQPLDQQYDGTNAAITSNVTAYLKINKVQIVPLHHVGNGVYMASDRLPIHSGNTYELFAKVNNMGIYSITTVPEAPTAESANFNNNINFQAKIYTTPGIVYGAAWEIYNIGNDQVIDAASDFQEVVQNKDSFSRSAIPVNTTALPEKYRSGNYSNLWYIRIYAYDNQYLKYFETRNNNQPISDVFSQGGDQIIWNVHGTNAIGLFIGVAKGKHIKVQ